jgi:hypothetical protein
MAILGRLIPNSYYNTLAASPYPALSVGGVPAIETGEIFTCTYTGRAWIGSDNSNAFRQPLALQWQWTSANAGTTLANIRRINSGVTADAVAGFEHTGAIVFSDILSAPMLGTDATGRVQAVTSAPAVTITARNNTGSQINKGQAVRISGALGQNPTISLAQANAYATTDAIGLAAANIGNNSTGSVIIAGTLTNLDTSAYTDGAVLYLSPTTAGALTATEPSRPNWQMQMGYVEYAHPTQGKILVRANLESTKTEYITDMTQAGVALATLAPLNEGVLLGRLSGIGNPEPVAIGYGMAMLGDLGVSLASASNALSADVVMTNAGTWYDGPSISLAAGTWMIDSCVTVQKGAVSGVGDLSARITNGTTHYASSEATWNTRSASMTSISLSTRITLASTTTIKVQAVSTFAASAIKAATIYQASGNNASNINAVRVA